MHLISALASGINGASGGSAKLLKRGTATPLTAWYADFEASQAYAGTVLLDANGGAVVYVNELTDVQVYDLSGVLLREFVAGDNASAVEVISPSFTGTNYVTGQVAANQPTTLQTVLDRWLTSAGSTNFNVLVGGVATSLQVALAATASLYFNVQSYGAKGDGTTDNASFIQAAITAAAAAGGGTIFFPPGTYRVTTQVTVPTGISVLGCGGTSSKLAIDSAVAAYAMEFTGADAGSRLCAAMWFGATGQNFTGSALVAVTGGAARVILSSCLFGNDSFALSALLRAGATGVSGCVMVNGCSFYTRADVACIVQTDSFARLAVINSDLITAFVGNLTHALIDGIDGLTVDGCRFDASSVTGGTGKYISFAPVQQGGAIITNNRFKTFAGVAALYNSLATPYYDCWESGNCFGDASSGSMTPYGYTTDGFTPVVQDIGAVRAHGSREHRSFGNVFNANLTLNAKAYGVVVVARTAVGAQLFSATLGTLGDKFTLQIINNAGGIVAPTFDVQFSPRAGYVANIPNLSTRTIQWQWLPDQLLGNNGKWVQIGVET